MGKQVKVMSKWWEMMSGETFKGDVEVMGIDEWEKLVEVECLEILHLCMLLNGTVEIPCGMPPLHSTA